MYSLFRKPALALVLSGWFLPFVAAAQVSTGTVYLVFGSDTAIWNAGTTVDVYSRYPHYSQSSFTDTNSPSFHVMDPSWRGQYKDSFGQDIKFTWWMMAGNIYGAADNRNVPEPNIMTLYLMKKYHGQALQALGDELSLHYHTFLWSDYNGTGKFYWNQTRTFAECRDDFDFTLAQFLLEENVFPASFRSGWHFMDQGWQEHLNQLVLYCLHDDFGVYRPWYTNSAPIAGVEDWSRAPSDFVPFHPSTNDYQVPGDGPGWNVRSIKMQKMVQADMDHLFVQASNGVDQVACIWDHLPENFVANVDRIGGFVHNSAAAYPGVAFRYCTAVEAMQRWRGTTNWPPPQIDVQQTVQGQTVTLTISTSSDIFQETPFVALRDTFHQYYLLGPRCSLSGSNSWTLTLPVPLNAVAKLGIAVTDLAGNVATRILHYLPDDLFLDNQDPPYSELQGAWTSTTNAAWGTDARVAAVTRSTTAQAQWFLPISRSGVCSLFVQVPRVSKAATNIVFTVMANGSNALSKTFTTGLPTNQWVHVGTLHLDLLVSNVLQMTVSGTNQAGTYAVADVLRVVALGDASPLLALAPTNSTFQLQIAGQPGQTCQIQRSTDLTAPWTTIDTITLPVEGTVQYTDSTAPSGRAFYRLSSSLGTP